MLDALLTLLTDALSGDFTAWLLLSPFLLAPLMIGGFVTEVCFPVSSSTGKRTFEMNQTAFLGAPVILGMLGCLGLLATTIATYGG